MSRQILLCVETNSKARTDYQYINETIHRFYVNDPKISYKPIFLESKSMYASPKKQKEIGKYIKAYPEELVFFCRDVEEVYLGKRVNDKDKVNEVKRFKSKKMIEAVLPQNLSQNEYKINGSNILNVLDKFWTRKN